MQALAEGNAFRLYEWYGTRTPASLLGKSRTLRVTSSVPTLHAVFGLGFGFRLDVVMSGLIARDPPEQRES